MKNVLVSGGSRGIGAEIVRLFAKNGYNVAFTYKKSIDKAKALEAETGAVAIVADSAIEYDIINAVEIARENIGEIDILINNAAISHIGLLTDMTLDEWNNVFNINVTSAFLYSKAVLPYMIHKKCGKIINISSMWGSVGASCEVAYSASKAALIGFTRALAKEVGPSGITVNTVSPGVINTDMNEHLSSDDIQALKEETPLLRIGEVTDVANAVIFLASDQASFITGEVINVNGGFVI